CDKQFDVDQITVNQDKVIVPIVIEPGQTTTCEFTNKLMTGNLEITKRTLGGDDIFNFSIIGEIMTENGAETQGRDGIDSGEYDIIEEGIPEDWLLKEAACSNKNGGTGVFNKEENGVIGAEILPEGELTQCEFLNVKLAKLKVIKNTDGTDDTFDYNLFLTPETANGQPEGPIATTPLSVTTEETFGESEVVKVDPTTKIVGEYNLTEEVTPGWLLDSVSCLRKDKDGNIANIGTPSTTGITDLPLTPGSETICTFNNVREDATLTIIKETADNACQGGIGKDDRFSYDVFKPKLLQPPVEFKTQNGCGQSDPVVLDVEHYPQGTGKLRIIKGTIDGDANFRDYVFPTPSVLTVKTYQGVGKEELFLPVADSYYNIYEDPSTYDSNENPVISYDNEGNIVDGFRFYSAYCDDGTATKTATGLSNITIADGETTTCTLISVSKNYDYGASGEKRGKLKIIKSAYVPTSSDEPGQTSEKESHIFKYSMFPTPSVLSVETHDSVGNEEANVYPDTYTISESYSDSPIEWKADSISCDREYADEGEGEISVVVGENDIAVCTFVNIPTYSVIETNISDDWSFTSATCQDQNGNTTGLPAPNGVAGIEAKAGDSIACTFKNRKFQGGFLEGGGSKVRLQFDAQ
ncbi:MAG: hypothetical protein Q7S10_00160, partial [bacterium]|nr:hypothetical protein [bacterium]